MIDTLISNKTRIKLLLKFFLNQRNRSYLRGLEQEFGESSNAIRIELNRLEGAGMLRSEATGNKKYFQANTRHPLFNEIQSIVKKYVGIDQIIENVVMRLGNVQEVYLTGTFAKGLNSQIIDIALVGKIEVKYLTDLIAKSEQLIDRKIRYIIYRPEDPSLKQLRVNPDFLLIWSENE